MEQSVICKNLERVMNDIGILVQQKFLANCFLNCLQIWRGRDWITVFLVATYSSILYIYLLHICQYFTCIMPASFQYSCRVSNIQVFWQNPSSTMYVSILPVFFYISASTVPVFCQFLNVLTYFGYKDPSLSLFIQNSSGLLCTLCIMLR